MPSTLEFIFACQLKAAEAPKHEVEYRFSAPRRWRFDFAWPERMLALEIEGGVHNRGRHTRPIGFEKDCEKYNCALVLGWKVLRVTRNHIVCGDALAWVEDMLNVA